MNHSVNGWQTYSLADVADIASGVTKGRRLEGPTVTVPYLRVANVQAGHLDLSEIKEIEVLASEVGKYRLQAGDILMTEGGDRDKLGRGTIWRRQIDPCIHQNHVFRVRPDSARLIPEFLNYYLQTPFARNYFLRCAKQTTGIASINRTQLSSLLVPLPPVPEQQRIADILDKADAIRRKRREAESIAASLRSSAFFATFGSPHLGWREHSLSELADVQGGIALSSRRGSFGRKVPYLRVANVFRDRLDLTEIKEVGVTDDEFDKTCLRKGDVLIVEGHGNREEIGRSAIWDGSMTRCVHQNHLIRAAPFP